MQGRLLGIGESLTAGWATFTKQAGVLIGIYVVYVAISGGVGAIPYIGGLISIFITPPIMGGVIKVGLKAVRGQAVEFGEVFSGFQEYWRWMGVYWLFIAILLATLIPFGIGALIAYLLGTFKGSGVSPSETAGIAIMVATGLISAVLYVMLAIRFMFAYYFVADGEEIVESFMKSAAVTQGRRLELFGIAIVLGLFSLVGVIGCGIGVILTSLISYLAFMHIYVGLRGDQPQPALPETPPSPA